MSVSSSSLHALADQGRTSVACVSQWQNRINRNSPSLSKPCKTPCLTNLHLSHDLSAVR